MEITNRSTETLIEKIDRLETAGMEITRQWFDIWDEAYRYFFSLHDRGVVNKVDWDYIVLNYIWPTAIQEIAKLTKNLQKVIALPWTDDDLEAAEAWQGVCQWHLQNPRTLNMRINHAAAIFCGKIRGYRVGRIYWEPKAEWDDRNKVWLGDIRYKLWRPEHFWADGDEDINDGNCGTVRWVDLDYARHRWRAFADEFERQATYAGDVEDVDYGGIKFKSWIAAGELKQAEGEDGERHIPDMAAKLLDIIEGSQRINKERRVVRISETFLKNYDEVPRSETASVPPEELILSGVAVQDSLGRILDAATGMPFTPETYPQKTVREWNEPLYPNGQWLISVGKGADRVILNSEESQRWNFRSWPFITSPHYLLPFKWQGLNAVTLYKSAQDMINTSVTHLVNNLKQFGDPRVSVEDGAIALDPKTKKPVNEGRISSAAGAVWRWAKGKINAYKVEYPVPPSPAAVSLYHLFAQEFKNLSGLQAISRGEPIPGTMTATEAQALSISSNDRISLQSIYEDEWFRGICSLTCEFLQEYYDVGRFVRIVGTDKIVGVAQITQKIKEVKFDIMVEPGATLPFDGEKKIAKTRMAYDLLQNPVANPLLPDMLRALEVPNWKKILAEFEPYRQYRAIVELYNQVVAGKMTPEQAAQIILNEATRLFMSRNPGAQLPAAQAQSQEAA